LRDLDLGLLTLLTSRHKDDKPVDLGHSIAPSARLGNGDFVLLSDFYWLGSVVGWTAAKARSPVTASSTLSVTRSSFISECTTLSLTRLSSVLKLLPRRRLDHRNT
jgi:hypothetical protein